MFGQLSVVSCQLHPGCYQPTIGDKQLTTDN